MSGDQSNPWFDDTPDHPSSNKPRRPKEVPPSPIGDESAEETRDFKPLEGEFLEDEQSAFQQSDIERPDLEVQSESVGFDWLSEGEASTTLPSDAGLQAAAFESSFDETHAPAPADSLGVPPSANEALTISTEDTATPLGADVEESLSSGIDKPDLPLSAELEEFAPGVFDDESPAQAPPVEAFAGEGIGFDVEQAVDAKPYFDETQPPPAAQTHAANEEFETVGAPLSQSPIQGKQKEEGNPGLWLMILLALVCLAVGLVPGSYGIYKGWHEGKLRAEADQQADDAKAARIKADEDKKTADDAAKKAKKVADIAIQNERLANEKETAAKKAEQIANAKAMAAKTEAADAKKSEEEAIAAATLATKHEADAKADAEEAHKQANAIVAAGGATDSTNADDLKKVGEVMRDAFAKSDASADEKAKWHLALAEILFRLAELVPSERGMHYAEAEKQVGLALDAADEYAAAAVDEAEKTKSKKLQLDAQYMIARIAEVQGNFEKSLAGYTDGEKSAKAANEGSSRFKAGKLRVRSAQLRAAAVNRGVNRTPPRSTSRFRLVAFIASQASAELQQLKVEAEEAIKEDPKDPALRGCLAGILFDLANESTIPEVKLAILESALHASSESLRLYKTESGRKDLLRLDELVESFAKINTAVIEQKKVVPAESLLAKLVDSQQETANWKSREKKWATDLAEPLASLFMSSSPPLPKLADQDARWSDDQQTKNTVAWMSALAADVKASGEASKKLADQLAQANVELAKLQATLTETQGMLGKQKDELEAVKVALKNARAASETLAGQLAQVNVDRSTLQSTLKETQDSLGKLKSEAEADKAALKKAQADLAQSGDWRFHENEWAIWAGSLAGLVGFPQPASQDQRWVIEPQAAATRNWMSRLFIEINRQLRENGHGTFEPARAELHYLNGRTLYFRGAYGPAFEQFSLAIAADPRDARYYLFRVLSRYYAPRTLPASNDATTLVAPVTTATGNLQVLRQASTVADDLRAARRLEERGRPGTSKIAWALERVQGPSRIWLERLRQQAAVAQLISQNTGNAAIESTAAR
jgi:hypothetical protein